MADASKPEWPFDRDPEVERFDGLSLDELLGEQDALERAWSRYGHVFDDADFVEWRELHRRIVELRGAPMSDQDWTPAFPGQRPPFRPVHGAYSTALEHSPRVLELVGEFRAQAPWLMPADELGLRLLALAVARLERSSKVTLDPPTEEAGGLDDWATRVKATSTLRRDERGWLRDAARLAHEFGLTPAGRVAIEERERSVVAIEEAQRAFSLLVAAAGRYVAQELRAEFIASLAAAEVTLGLSAAALVEGEIVDEGEEPA